MRYIITGLLFAVSTLSFGQTNVPNDTLHWSATRQITWEDFKGAPMEGIGLNGESFCMILATFERPNGFQKTKCKVVAIFDRTKSWIIPEHKSDVGLAYFQVMFSIYEVHARGLRRELAAAKFGNDPTPLFQEKYNQSMTNLTTEFNQFRQETKLGRDAGALSKWKIKVEEELKAMEEYKRN